MKVIKIMVMMFAVIALIGAASACSCIVPKSVSEEVRFHDLVFQGKVMSIDSTYSGKEVIFEVEEDWKMADAEAIKLETASDSASCGYEFVEGESYVVYAKESEGVMSVSLCSRTALVKDASEDLEVLGELDSSNPYGISYSVVMTSDNDVKDSYELNEAYTLDKWLVLNVSYSGGCSEHKFELRAEEALSKSLPPQRGIYLYHDAQGDACEAYVSEMLTFDLTKLDEQYNDVVYNLRDYNGQNIPITNTLISGEGEKEISFFGKIIAWFKDIFN